jgi:sulfide dehydrogenase cytochrome subunit
MRILGILLGVALVTAAVPATAQMADVSILASTCSGCHGSTFDGSGAIPGLRGQKQAYLGNQLQAFKVGARPGTVMNRLAKGYTEDEIIALSLYFSQLKEGGTP